tara:strand:+ start:287 stop:430 length:144 start_codon:yes stop_codon:yes gene_type:complete
VGVIFRVKIRVEFVRVNSIYGLGLWLGKKKELELGLFKGLGLWCFKG